MFRPRDIGTRMRTRRPRRGVVDSCIIDDRRLMIVWQPKRANGRSRIAGRRDAETTEISALNEHSRPDPGSAPVGAGNSAAASDQRLITVGAGNEIGDSDPEEALMRKT